MKTQAPMLAAVDSMQIVSYKPKKYHPIPADILSNDSFFMIRCLKARYLTKNPCINLSLEVEFIVFAILRSFFC